MISLQQHYSSPIYAYTALSRFWCDMKFCFIVGLPGSGKSFLGQQMEGLFLDDISRSCGPKRLKEKFYADTVIVTDPLLCRTGNRCFIEKIIKENHPNCEMEWIYFENAPDKCWKNVQHRNDGREISKYTIDNLSKNYIIPEGAKIIKVWENS